jgi:hypothetical protein
MPTTRRCYRNPLPVSRDRISANAGAPLCLHVRSRLVMDAAVRLAAKVVSGMSHHEYRCPRVGFGPRGRSDMRMLRVAVC